jgi:multicomponent Na+:H+ antiporter subunit D
MMQSTFEILLVLPFLIPLLAALLCATLGLDFVKQRFLSLFAATLLLAVDASILYLTTYEEMILVLPIGSWMPGVGIVWVADTLSGLFLFLAALIFLMTLVITPLGVDALEKRYFIPLLHLLMVGINGAFLTGDLFNLFVFFEVLLVASFVLISQGEPLQRVRKALPYVIINLIASAIFLLAVGIIYSATGTVTMAELGHRLNTETMSGPFWLAALLIIVVFCIKAGLVPWHYWLPDSYPQASIPVNALFAGLLTKVGIYALYRFVPLLNRADISYLNESLLLISALTMSVGVIGALGRSHLREILSFHIISQVGYMVFGLGLGTGLAMAAGLFYILHHIVVKSALFMAVGIVELRAGSGKLGVAQGVLSLDPTAAGAFLVLAMALAGLPPFSGFWAKLFLIAAGFQNEAWITSDVAIVVGLLTLASMLKIWNASYWGDADQSVWKAVPNIHRLHVAALNLAALSLGTGLIAFPLFDIFGQHALKLLTGDQYITAVLELDAAGLKGARP